MYRSISLPIIILLCILCGCSVRPESPRAETRLVKDDLGRTVTLPVTIERAVSLAPSITESIFAAGGGDRLVGVTSFCNYPEEAKRIQKVGDTVRPNIEAIVALKPQVVFVSTASQIETFTRQMESEGITVFVSDPKDIEGIFSDIRRFGDLFSTSFVASATLNSLQTRIMDVDAFKYEYRPTVFLQISKEPLFSIGKESFLTEIIYRAGGRSVTGDVTGGYPRLSKETAVSFDPDVIVLSDSEDNREVNEVFRNSRAVKTGRVYRIDADLISRPGPRMVDTLEKLSTYLHGEVEK